MTAPLVTAHRDAFEFRTPDDRRLPDAPLHDSDPVSGNDAVSARRHPIAA